MKRRPQSIPGLLLTVLRIYAPRVRVPRAALLALGVLALFGAGRWIAGGSYCGAHHTVAVTRDAHAARNAHLRALAARWPALGRCEAAPHDRCALDADCAGQGTPPRCVAPATRDVLVPAAVWPAATASFSPSVAWNGSEYGVAWIDTRDGATELYFARVSAAGARVGAETRVTRRDSLKVMPQLVWAGRDWAAVWTDVADETIAVYFARLATDGRALGQPLRLSRGDALDLLPRIAWTGRAHGVAWYHLAPDADTISVWYAQVTGQGEPAGEAHAIRNDVLPTGTLDIAANDGRFGVAFSEFDFAAGRGVTALQRVEPGGAAGQYVEVARAQAINGAAATAWTGQAYGLVWQDDMDDEGERATPCFASVASTGVEVRRTPLLRRPEYVTGVQLAWSGSEYAAVWTGERSGGRYDAFLARVARTGAAQGAPVRVTATSADAMAPSVAWSGHEYGVAWHDTRERGTVGVYFARVSAQGVKVGGDTRVTGN